VTRARWKAGWIALAALAVGASPVRAQAEGGVPRVHYHANFAIWIAGERFDLSGARYMEAVAACSTDPHVMTPPERVHLHDHNPDLVHVHDGDVTWADLLVNLGFALSDSSLTTPAGRRYESGSGGTLKFVLNGASLPDVATRQIVSEDRLLLSFGVEAADEVARTQFASVAATAREQNGNADPGSCGGSAGHPAPADGGHR
jgi:hypothetical protein